MTAGRAAAGLRGFLRFSIASILLVTGAGKLLDVRGFAEVLRSYDAFPARALLPLALAVPLAELLLSAWLLSGRRLLGAGLCSMLLHFSYALWSAVSVLRGLRLGNCGCFGVFLPRPLGWSTVLEDLLVAGASGWLATLSRERS